MAFVRRSVERYIQSQPLSDDAQRRAIASAIAVVEKLEPIYTHLRAIDPRAFSDDDSSDGIGFLSQNYPDAFAKRYFFKNIVKCAMASSIYSSQFKNVRRVVDLGTGPGTFLFSFATSQKNNEFVGIDKSSEALRVAQRLFAVARIQCPLLINSNLPRGIISGGRFFTASYLLAELKGADFYGFASFFARRTDAQFLIVDYPEVAYRFIEAIAGARRCTGQGVDIELPPWLAEKVGDDHISFGIVYAPISTSSRQTISRELGAPQHIGLD